MQNKRMRRGGVAAAILAGALALTACTGPAETTGDAHEGEPRVYVRAMNGDVMTGEGMNA